MSPPNPGNEPGRQAEGLLLGKRPVSGSTSKTPLGIDKPRLPEHLYAKSQGLAWLFIAYAVAMYSIPGVTAWLVWESGWTVWIKLPLIAALWMVAQQGLHLLGFVGHEGFHFNLHRDRRVSCLMGIFFSSMLATFFEIGAAISHWNHHLYTNRPGDPDIPIFCRYRGLLARMLFARGFANGIYRKNTLALLRNQELGYARSLPFSKKTVRGFAWFNLGCSLAWTSLYITILVWEPALGVIAIVVPHLAGLLFTGIRSYLEHADTEVGEFVDTRTYASPALTVLYYYNNYHLEHHLYPAIPCYRLAAVHRFLRDHGYYADSRVRIDRSFLEAYQHAGSRYQYPNATGPSAADTRLPQSDSVLQSA